MILLLLTDLARSRLTSIYVHALRILGSNIEVDVSSKLPSVLILGDPVVQCVVKSWKVVVAVAAQVF